MLKERKRRIKIDKSFQKVQIIQIVTFDAEISLSINDSITTIFKDTKYFNNSIPQFLELDEDIYDLDFIRKNSKSMFTIESEINLSELKNIKKFDYFDYFGPNVKIIVNFDQCQIAIAKFIFDINPPENCIINTDKLIAISEETSILADKELFNTVKDDFSNTEIRLDNILKEHMTYSVVSICETLNISDREILGIVWGYSSYYNIKNEILKKVLENSIPVEEGDIFTLTPISTFISVPDKNYIDKKIFAIEMGLREKFLLKKIDFQIDELLGYINSENLDIDSALKKIKDTQIKLNSELEFYRNVNVSVTFMFSLLFETFNEVFNLNKHYKSIKDKLNTCKGIYESLNNEKQRKNEEKRKKQLDIIQWAVFILGISTLLATIGLSFELVYLQASVLIIVALTLFSGFLFIKYKINN